jgi:predicted porin
MQRKSLFRGLFADFFGLEKPRWANCAQLPRFGGSAPETAVFKQTTGEVFMQKKLLALAVAGALAPAAAMAQSTVEIYGRANLGLDNWRATGASVSGNDFKSRNRVFDSGSRLGFRVNEGLGGGMRAFVVMETGVNVDSGNNTAQSGLANGSTGFWASRDSYLGIGGGWGDVRWGRQSIWWSNGVIAQTGANYINTAVDGLTTGGLAIAVPVTRQSNVMSYNSPTFGGFNASLSYSPSGSEGAGYTGTGQERDSVWGITGRYTSGALRAQVDWAKRKNVNMINGQDYTGFKLGVGWAYAAGSQISVVHERLENKNLQSLGTTATPGISMLLSPSLGIATAGQNAKQKVNLVNWEHMLGQWQLLAQYAWTGKLEGVNITDDTRTKGFTIAGKYFLSKRTGAYLSWSEVKNEANAIGDLTGGGYSTTGSSGSQGLPAASRGADVRILGLGVMHNF